MSTTLEVNQTSGRLNLNIKPPNMSLQTKHDADFSINKRDGKLKINTKDAKVEISTREARAFLHHKFYKIYSKDLAQKGFQDSMQGIARYAKQGDQMARIEKEGKPVISQAKSNSEDPKREIGLRSQPSAEIKSSPGEVKTDYTRSEISTDSKSHWPQGKLDWGKVEMYLNPEPKFEIQAVDVKA